MKASKWLDLVTLLLLIVGICGEASAGVPIGVQIGSTTLPAGQDCVIIGDVGGTTYPISGGGNITIQPAAPGGVQGQCSTVASVQAIDGNNDNLYLTNAKITTDTAFSSDYLISFWGTFAPPPATGVDPNNPNVIYTVQLSSGGTLINSANGQGAATAVVKLRGKVEYPVGSGNWWQITTAQLQKTISGTSYTFFSPPYDHLTAVYPAQLTDNRVIKGEFSFRMPQKTDVLTISNVNNIIIQGAASAGPPTEIGCECAPTPYSSLSWLCRWLGWGCPDCTMMDLPTPPVLKNVQ